MYSFSDSKKLPIIKVVCDCKRQFIQEEFYTCFECQETYCRFCTKQEILEKFCRKCQNKESQTDYNFKTHCSKCFECPFCKNVLSVQLDKQEQSAKYNYFFNCQFCSWNSKARNITENDYELLAKSTLSNFYDKVDKDSKFFKQIVNNQNELRKAQEYQKKFSYVINNQNQKQNKPQRKKLTYEQLDEQIEKQKEVTKQEEEQLDTQNLIQFPLIPEDNQLQLIKEKSSEKNQQINKYLNTIYDSSDKTLEQELAGFTKANFEFNTTSDETLKYPLIQPQHQSKLEPLPFNFIAKRNRKCCKCNANIVRFETGKLDQNDFKISQFLCNSSPVLKIKSFLPDKNQKNSYIIRMNVYNKTKNDLEVQFSDINEEFLDEFELLQANILTDKILKIPSIYPRKEYNDPKQLDIQFQLGENYKTGQYLKLAINITSKVLDRDQSEPKSIFKYNVLINLGDPLHKQN